MRRWKAALLPLALAACAPRPVSAPAADDRTYLRVGALELSAVLEQDATDLMGSVDIMNLGSRPVLLEYEGSCAVAIVLGRNGAQARRWDALEFWRRRPEICRPEPTRLEIPGRTLARILTPPVTQAQILGDSLPAGRYEGVLRLRMLQPRDTTILLPAGPVDIGSSSRPLLGD